VPATWPNTSSCRPTAPPPMSICPVMTSIGRPRWACSEHWHEPTDIEPPAWRTCSPRPSPRHISSQLFTTMLRC
jgi:hypothetical protein